MSFPGVKPTHSVIYYENPNNNKVDPLHIMNQAFNDYDKGMKGNLNWNEFDSFINYVVSKQTLGKNEAEFFRNYMQNVVMKRNGQISKQQILQLWNKHAKNVQHSQNGQQKKYTQQELVRLVDEMFAKYDKNKTGEMDYPQLTNYLKSQWEGKINYHDVVKAVDKDRNGLINKAELLAFLKMKLL